MSGWSITSSSSPTNQSLFVGYPQNGPHRDEQSARLSDGIAKTSIVSKLLSNKELTSGLISLVPLAIFLAICAVTGPAGWVIGIGAILVYFTSFATSYAILTCLDKKKNDPYQPATALLQKSEMQRIKMEEQQNKARMRQALLENLKEFDRTRPWENTFSQIDADAAQKIKTEDEPNKAQLKQALLETLREFDETHPLENKFSPANAAAARRVIDNPKSPVKEILDQLNKLRRLLSYKNNQEDYNTIRELIISLMNHPNYIDFSRDIPDFIIINTKILMTTNILKAKDRLIQCYGSPEQMQNDDVKFRVLNLKKERSEFESTLTTFNSMLSDLEKKKKREQMKTAEEAIDKALASQKSLQERINQKTLELEKRNTLPKPEETSPNNNNPQAASS